MSSPTPVRRAAIDRIEAVAGRACSDPKWHAVHRAFAAVHEVRRWLGSEKLEPVLNELDWVGVRVFFEGIPKARQFYGSRDDALAWLSALVSPRV